MRLEDGCPGRLRSRPGPSPQNASVPKGSPALVSHPVRWLVPGLAVVGVLGALSSGCSSTTATGSQALSVECQHVSAVLSDGPDPTADPVGYAEAQVLPLTNLHITDPALHSAAGRLDAAFRAVYDTNGSASATVEETRAGSAVNAICPGAAG
jgi:hypothetical protein